MIDNLWYLLYLGVCSRIGTSEKKSEIKPPSYSIKVL